MSRWLDAALDIYDLRRQAQKRLPKGLFESIDHGSEDDIAFRHNRDALNRIKLVPRVLRDVSQLDTSVELLGETRGLPLIVAPTGSAGFVSYRGETALARAAAKAGIPFVLTSTAGTPMEKVIANGGGTPWYQA